MNAECTYSNQCIIINSAGFSFITRSRKRDYFLVCETLRFFAGINNPACGRQLARIMPSKQGWNDLNQLIKISGLNHEFD